MCGRRIAFEATFAIPPRGTVRTSTRLRTHDRHRLPTSPVGRRRHARRRLGIRPDAQPGANSNGAGRLGSKWGYARRQADCTGPEPERKAEPVERRHPSERGGPGHREAGAQGARSERGAAARDFGWRSRTAAKMSAACCDWLQGPAGFDPTGPVSFTTRGGCLSRFARRLRAGGSSRRPVSFPQSSRNGQLLRCCGCRKIVSARRINRTLSGGEDNNETRCSFVHG